MIERKILIGLITSANFLRKVEKIWRPGLLGSSFAKIISSWCLEYYEKYETAPGKDIETIYERKIKQGLSEDVAEVIEEDILPSLSEEYIKKGVKEQALWEETFEYFQERHLELHQEEIKELLNEGNIEEAERLSQNYSPLAQETEGMLDFSDKRVLRRITEAFKDTKEYVVRWPGALGKFWNEQFVRGGFVAFKGPEKRGKTYMLLEVAMRAVSQGKSVAFFQAGDMTEKQQIMRICSYRTKKTTKEKHAGTYYEPVTDCVWNQLDECDREERECEENVFEGEFEGYDARALKRDVTKKDLIEAYKRNPKYAPCTNCLKFREESWGTPWVEKVQLKQLTPKKAREAVKEFFVERIDGKNKIVRKNRGRFRLSTHSTKTLTVTQIKSILKDWEKDGFIADVIIVDYADLLEDHNKEFRHKQDAIWTGLRGLSHHIWKNKRQALVVSATQADAKSYEQNWIKLSNFTEDKRKYAHVTAMYGLNRDPKKGDEQEEREKEIGMLRINELVVREDESNPPVVLLQNLRISRPFLTSYWH